MKDIEKLRTIASSFDINLVTAHLKKKIEAKGGDPLREALTLV